MSSGRIAVTGLGLVSAVGWSPAEAWAAIEAGRSGLGKLSLFASERCGHFPVAEVKGDPAAKSGLASGSRSNHLAVLAARQAFAEAGLGGEKGPAGVVLGACTGGMLDSEEFLRRLLKEGRRDAELLRHHECASTTLAVARELGLGGHQATVSTACSSGALAIAAAGDALLSGQAEVMLAGGVDSLTKLTLNGFCSLLIVDPDGCRPFDAARRGMNLGEGAGILALETEEHARRRGARIRGFVAGWGLSCDAHHPTLPDPEGAGLLRAMTRALAAAGLSPADIGYVNAHGTGTVENDRAEARALSALFGERTPPVSSTKRFFGHTLAAAGAIEAIVCLLALERGRLPANLGIERPDPEFRLDLVDRPRDARAEAALSNSMGFGGNNCALVFGRGE